MRRGLYTLTGYRLATKFPFALFRKSRDVDAPLELLVYPARVAVPRPPPRAHVRGDATANRLGRRGEFFGLRERRTGDDRRDVHWKSSARTGRLLVREYEDELARRVVIGVDNALPEDVRDAVADGALDAGAPRRRSRRSSARSASPRASRPRTSRPAGPSSSSRAARTSPPAGPHARGADRPRARGAAVRGETSRVRDRLPPRIESVLVAPRGVVAPNRPTTTAR